jgi:hypothetical protein
MFEDSVGVEQLLNPNNTSVDVDCEHSCCTCTRGEDYTHKTFQLADEIATGEMGGNGSI